MIGSYICNSRGTDGPRSNNTQGHLENSRSNSIQGHLDLKVNLFVLSIVHLICEEELCCNVLRSLLGKTGGSLEPSGVLKAVGRYTFFG